MTRTPLTPPGDDVPALHVELLALRPKDAARALGIGQRLLWSLTNQGVIPCVKFGRCTVYPVDMLREHLRREAQGVDHGK